MNFFLLINVEMSGKITFNAHLSLKKRLVSADIFYTYEHLKFHAQLS